MKPTRSRRPLAPLAGLVLLALAFARPAPLRADDAAKFPVFDLTRADQAAAWHADHATRLEPTPDGLEIAITGEDPYLSGPARDYPAGVPLLLKARVMSQSGGPWQVFYYDRTPPLEKQSIGFETGAGAWQDVAVPLPALGPGYRFRIDPPGTAGVARIARLAVVPMRQIAAPAWPKPDVLDLADPAPSVHSGELTLRHAADRWGGFTLSLAGQRVAVGGSRPLIGYLRGDTPVWIDVAATATVTTRRAGSGVVVEARLTDADGGHWSLRQTFTPAAPGAIEVGTEVSVDADRPVVYLPLLMVHPGLGTHGTRKGQGLLAGVEYLDDEPSSSEADVEGPGAKRLVPLAAKLTFPLMAIQSGGHYVALIWDRSPGVAALFDSPDRTFRTGSHALGLIAPGSDGKSRSDGALFPYEPTTVAAGRAVRCQARIIAGRGDSVVPAVQQYVALRALPPLPPRPDAAGYVELAARAWLDTPIREGGLFRHAALGNSFRPQPAADAAWMIDRLAALEPGGPLAGRLRALAEEATHAVPPSNYYHAGVSHLRAPVAPLVLGHVPEAMIQARQHARGLLGQFDAHGAIVYHAPGRGPDYGRTHSSREASGFAANTAAEVLRAAAFSGDRALVADAVRALEHLDRFRNGVPRGAQTWEIPLHTPDILGAAHLVHAYTLGYELSGDPALLASARYWAWTGVPFVYLVNPTGQRVGPYATIPVLGATGWVAPLWIGLPVQWCGAVYADALFDLARHDPGGPWTQIASGITLSGLQQSYPLEHPHRGLLPDSFNLGTQSRNPSDINPGTLEPLALRVLTGRPSYELRALRASGLWVHAPGALEQVSDTPGRASFTVAGWSERPYSVVVHGLRSAPRLMIDGKAAAVQPPHQFLPDPGSLILQLQGTAAVAIETAP
jgi:hypothetical protein